MAYSVIKNALYKVIKLADARELGSHIVVQGGTFYNKAVLRALEKIAGAQVTCPDICGLMGAFGAALIARERYAQRPAGAQTTTLSFDDIRALQYHSTTARCGGCENNCLLTINTFSGGRRYITGNPLRKEGGRQRRQEGRKPGGIQAAAPLFGYEPLPPEQAPRGVIGIPRVLNIYENYPFWATFFRALGFRTVLSPFSSPKLYQLGMDSIPSESECYPAKLAHGHVQWLINSGIETIFHPSVFYEYQETACARNHFNCPMVIGYPENIRNNVENVADGRVRYIHPFMAFTDEATVTRRLEQVCLESWGIRRRRCAVPRSWHGQSSGRPRRISGPRGSGCSGVCTILVSAVLCWPAVPTTSTRRSTTGSRR